MSSVAQKLLQEKILLFQFQFSSYASYAVKTFFVGSGIVLGGLVDTTVLKMENNMNDEENSKR